MFEIFIIKVKIVNLQCWSSWRTGRPGDLKSETDPHPLTSSLVCYYLDRVTETLIQSYLVRKTGLVTLYARWKGFCALFLMHGYSASSRGCDQKPFREVHGEWQGTRSIRGLGV